jgi:signal transduction histidine kinase
VLDERWAVQSLVRPLLEQGLDPGASGWIVRDRDGHAVLAGADPPAGPPTLSATLAGNFPPWLVEFHARPQDPWRVLLTSSHSVYLYMFLAIATILAFGLVLTVRAVNHEVELARLKSDFVSTVSHEFRSPLTSILQLSEMLQTGRVASEERRQWYYDVLVEQSARLSALVTNVLDLARIDEGRKEFRSEPVDLAGLVEELVTTARHRVGHEGFQVDLRVQEPLPEVRGDAEALRQAVSNLLDNAFQYSGDAKRVDVRLRAGERTVTVEVEDRGIGIPEDELDQVFERFHRGDGEASRSVRGSGLGLTLVKEIVDAHGGTVDVTSEVGEGSTFRITLPTATEVSRG